MPKSSVCRYRGQLLPSLGRLGCLQHAVGWRFSLFKRSSNVINYGIAYLGCFLAGSHVDVYDFAQGVTSKLACGLFKDVVRGVTMLRMRVQNYLSVLLAMPKVVPPHGSAWVTLGFTSTFT